MAKDEKNYVTRGVGDDGVPMLAGDPSEPQGPEDAYGPGPKRGDYSNRLGENKEAYTYALNSKGEAVRVHLNPFAQEHGEKAGKKGGVDTGTLVD